jgi:hypothetical protein
VALYRLHDALPDLDRPSVVIALDGWVDAGSAATAAVELIAEGARPIATFEGDDVFDYRARRPTLEIVDGRPETLKWPSLTLAHARIEGRDILAMTGAEPDYRWQQMTGEIARLATELRVAEWISLGAIPAAIPHTRAVPVLGTASDPSLLKGGVQPGPEGTLRVPAAAISVIDIAVSGAGIPTVGYFAQIPHYVSGVYPAASIELLRVLEDHLGVTLPRGRLAEESRLMRVRLDAAAKREDSTRTYIERLESMVDESRLPSGSDLISDIERFLREGGGNQGGSGRPN